MCDQATLQVVHVDTGFRGRLLLGVFFGRMAGTGVLGLNRFFSHFNESKMNEEEELYSKNLIFC